MIAAMLGAVAPAQAARLRAGVGRADITPRTGYYLGGYTRADRVAKGQQTRLFATALVLQRGRQKVALVSVDLFMVAGGIQQQAAQRAGFSPSNVLISASHSHSGPGGFANFKSYNTAAPSLQTITDPISYFRLLNPPPADPALYTFLVQQIAKAIQRADRDRAPAVAAWGATQIHYGLTENRSIEAHLADHGIHRAYGHGRASMDPDGLDHTIDPEVNVLRVDKLVRRHRRHRHRRHAHTSRRHRHRRHRSRYRRVPIGAWSTFADHGTVNKSTFQVYSEDHHGAAIHVFESRLRKLGRVPRRQLVVNVYGNTDEGDISAGLHRSGPAAAEYVGRREAAAMLRAWRLAGRRLTREGVLVITAQRHRTQGRNREDALARLVELIRRAAVRVKQKERFGSIHVEAIT
jgi:hypothetical protein